jgi:hypothetical protein
MTRWTDGAVWQPAADPDNKAIWDQVDANVGYPDVFINGLNRCDQVDGLNWRSGRPWWFSDPEGGSCTITLNRNVADIEVGQPVVISAAPKGGLWIGTVDTVAYGYEPDGDTTTVVANDALATFSQIDLADVHAQKWTAGDLRHRVAEMATFAGVPNTVADPQPSSSFLPALNASAANVTGTLLEKLRDYERSSNAIVGIDRSGVWRIQPRAGLPEGSVPDHVTPLVDDACPVRVTEVRASVDRVINSWALGAKIDSQASIVKYGRRTYEAKSDSTKPLYATDAATDPDNPPIYYEGMVRALATPMPSLIAEVRVSTRTSPVVPLTVFDFVSYGTHVYQVMAMEWQAAPDEWTVVLSLDPTGNQIGDRGEVTPVPPPTTLRETITVAITGDAYVAKTSGGLYAGNGAGDNLLVGLLTDGTLTRALLKTGTIPFKGKVKTVYSAKLRMYTSTYDCMTAGSSPSIKALRITGSWSEGSYNAASGCGFATSNAVKYPGPNVTTTDAVTKTAPKTDNTICEFTVTGIVRAWVAGSPNYGIALRGASETSSSNRAEFWGRSASTTSRRPVLVIDYEYEVA